MCIERTCIGQACSDTAFLRASALTCGLRFVRKDGARGLNENPLTRPSFEMRLLPSLLETYAPLRSAS